MFYFSCFHYRMATIRILNVTGQWGATVCNQVIVFLVEPQPLVGWGLLITESSRSYSGTLHSVGLLWTSEKPEAETSTWLHTTLIRDIRPCPGGVRSHNPSKQVTAEPQLRLRGYTVPQTVTNKYKLGPLRLITQGADNPCSRLLQTLQFA